MVSEEGIHAMSWGISKHVVLKIKIAVTETEMQRDKDQISGKLEETVRYKSYSG